MLARRAIAYALTILLVLIAGVVLLWALTLLWRYPGAFTLAPATVDRFIADNILAPLGAWLVLSVPLVLAIPCWWVPTMRFIRRKTTAAPIVACCGALALFPVSWPFFFLLPPAGLHGNRPPTLALSAVAAAYVLVGGVLGVCSQLWTRTGGRNSVRIRAL